MEQQSKKAYEKALEIYHSEINSIIASASTKNLATLRKTQKRLEDELRKFVTKELRSYSHLSEITEKLLVTILLY